MGGIRKAASKIHRTISKTADPIGHKLYGEKLTDKIEDFTTENVWAGQEIDPEDPVAPKVAEMPDTEALERARRVNGRRRQQSGRASTILTDSNDRLGG